jgi:hypothetical protein
VFESKKGLVLGGGSGTWAAARCFGEVATKAYVPNFAGVVQFTAVAEVILRST